MKTGFRPQYYRIRRMVQMVREGADRYAQGLLTYAQVNGGFKITGIDASFTGNFLPIPESLAGHPVTSIGGSAFRNRRSLAAVTIPASVTSIGNFAFSGCSALSSIIIGNGVTSISNMAFYFCSALTSVTIPASVTSIGEGAFANCHSLAAVTIPDSVTSIGEGAFCGCSILTSVTIPASVTSIGNGAFSCCSALTSVTIPASVTSIGDRAFTNCRFLSSVTIPASVISIGKEAFSYCSALTSVTIPASVTSIGTSVFSGCASLTTVTIPASVSNISAHIFDRCTSLTSVTIPSGVTSIGDFAFSYCSALTSVTIPASVHSIEGSAFFGCSSLASILFTGDAPTVFSNDADDIPVAFPRAFFNTRAKIYFRPGTSGWGAKPKEKMIFQSEDEFDAYVDKHPDETFCWMMGEDYEIVPGEAAPATETAAPEPAAKQEATPTEEGWKTSQAAKEPDTVPGATTAERVVAALEANPERAERAREEASGNAEASSEEVNAARVKETDIDTGEVRYRLSRDIELGLVTPDTSLSLSPFILTVHGKIWDREFGGLAHNPDQLAAHILSMPAEIAAARIMVADAIVKHLAANPAHRFHPGEGYVSMGPEIRESFQARWFKDH